MKTVKCLGDSIGNKIRMQIKSLKNANIWVLIISKTENLLIHFL